MDIAWARDATQVKEREAARMRMHACARSHLVGAGWNHRSIHGRRLHAGCILRGAAGGGGVAPPSVPEVVERDVVEGVV
jgi:hypothetical protein